MLLYLISKGLILFVVIPFLLLLWIGTAMVCYVFYKFLKGEF